MLKITQKDRKRILELKHKTLLDGTKGLGTSAKIYEMVLCEEDETLKSKLVI
jgi:hypothetical protein